MGRLVRRVAEYIFDENRAGFRARLRVDSFPKREKAPEGALPHSARGILARIEPRVSSGRFGDGTRNRVRLDAHFGVASGDAGRKPNGGNCEAPIFRRLSRNFPD
ncbi:hypothetical protein V1291_005686 [Nitrobacteraceae bacterium AZCC 1564]